MAQLSISNVINISVSQAGVGLGEYNTSNLALFTQEQPGNSFGTDGFKIYKEPTSVGEDFGTASVTYQQAIAVFSQSPNILANGGYLVIFSLTVATQHIAASGTPASGVFKLNYGGNASADINWNDTASQIQVKVRAIPGLEGIVITGSIAAGLNAKFFGQYGVQALMTVTANTLATSAPVAVTLTVTTTTPGETLAAAITATLDQVQYFGIMAAAVIPQVDMLAAAAVVQAENKMAFFVQNDGATVEVGGALDLLRSGGFNKSRGLYYGSDLNVDALLMQAAYAGRGLSVNFSGSNTTITMHLKDLITIQPDPSMNQTLLQKCLAAGADTYVSIQGVAKVFCSGANKFFDQVYNLGWFVGGLQIAGFNLFAQTSTKIPQTEGGMDQLKGAYRKVCQQAITNQYGAPGTWTRPETFGNQQDFFANISQIGFYIYSAPISQQLPTDRADRKAPLCQIALKEAGAMQESDVLVYINA